MSGQREKDLEGWIMDLAAAHTLQGPAREAHPARLVADARQAERGLREVHERFESAFNNAPIGMALLDMDGHWLQVNAALCRITGYTAARLRATTLRAITHPDDVGLDKQGMRALLAGEAPNSQCEKRYQHA